LQFICVYLWFQLSFSGSKDKKKGRPG